MNTNLLTPPDPMEAALDEILQDFENDCLQVAGGAYLNNGPKLKRWQAKRALTRLLLEARRAELEDLQRKNWITNQLYGGNGTIKLETLIQVLDERIAQIDAQIKETEGSDARSKS